MVLGNRISFANSFLLLVPHSAISTGINITSQHGHRFKDFALGLGSLKQFLLKKSIRRARFRIKKLITSYNYVLKLIIVIIMHYNLIKG